MKNDSLWLDELIVAQTEVHRRIVGRVRQSMFAQDPESLAQVAREGADDMIYHLDVKAEEQLRGDLEEIFDKIGHLTVVMEGQESGPWKIPSSQSTLPHYILIIDPVDGTRGLIYGKRSAFVLSAIALDDGSSSPSSTAIECAVQTEVPTTRSHLSDQLAARRHQGWAARCWNLTNDKVESLSLTPSLANSINGGFATICRFFPPGRDRLAALDDALFEAILGPPCGRAPAFEDQYLCTGGLLYQLISGRDRFVADLRGVLNDYREKSGLERGLTAHPYDLCTALIAKEAGVILSDGHGENLEFPLDATSEVSWIGFANKAIQEEVEEKLHELIPRHFDYRTNQKD